MQRSLVFKIFKKTKIIYVACIYRLPKSIDRPLGEGQKTASGSTVGFGWFCLLFLTKRVYIRKYIIVNRKTFMLWWKKQKIALMF